MNKLTITKKGFFDDIDQLTYANPALDIVEMIYAGTETKKKHYVLTFPERFYPNNAAPKFWQCVGKLIKEGSTFTVRTTDLFAVGWSCRLRTENIEGWDSIEIERLYEKPDRWERTKITRGYGRRVSDLMADFRF